MISAIVCTYNRDKYIYNVLQSIALNDYPRNLYEIVLVNNNSTDRTQDECQRFQADYPDVQFHYYVETNQGLSHARNCGIRHAQGDLLVYVDDDATVNTQYLRTYADFFARKAGCEQHPDGTPSHSPADPLAVAAGGPILPVYETQEPDWMSHYTRQLITGKLYLGDKEKEFPHGAFPGGGNACYRKSVFDSVGLFNVELGRKGNSLIGAEEKDLFDKMTTRGMKFYYLPNAILYHIIPEKKLTNDYFRRLTYSIGVSERYRTRQISQKKYLNRLWKECIKWGGTLVLWLSFALKGQFAKGNKLVAFRANVTRGLLKG
jgi:glycosyltransferase involved in cell wall biosynthesis